MTATITRLETDRVALWRRWNGARQALIAHPTPAGFDACMEAFKPYYIRVVGKGWQISLPAAMEAERRACVAAMRDGEKRRG